MTSVIEPEQGGDSPSVDPGLRFAEVGFESQSSLTRLGKYDVLARLGQGGMAGVYLAVARGAVEDFRKLVVLKVLHENYRREPKYVEMFMREAQISADLAHPNVVHTYTVGEEDGQYCIVMEYLDGVSLSAVLKRAAEWPLEKRLPLLGALCLALSGLHYVHEFRDMDGKNLQLVHRDVKPANVFITFDGQVKVLDFGVAKMTAPEVEETAGQAVKGTVQYIAPEALDMSRKVDRRLDVFAAGLMTWEIARGKRFWGERNHLQVLRCLASGDMPDLKEDRGDVPEELIETCRSALSYDPEKRHGSALDLKRDIQSFLIMEGFRIDTEQLAAIVGKMFGKVRERRQSVIQEQLRRLRDSGDDPVFSLAGSAEPMDIANPSDTDISAVFTPPSGMLSGAPAEPTRRDNANAASASSEEAGGGAVPGWIWLAAIALALVGIALYATSGDDDGAQPTVVAAGAARAEKTTSAPATPSAKPEAAPTKAADDPATEVTVTVSTTPADAKIFIDGVLHASNPAKISGEVTDDEHEVIARAPGFTEAVATITLDRTRELTLTLNEAPQLDSPDAEQTPRRRRRRRGAGNADATGSATNPASAEPTAAAGTKPSSKPKPGDDLRPSKKKKGSSGKKIDADVPWGE